MNVVGTSPAATSVSGARQAPTPGAELQAIVFRLGDEVYGIEIGFVHEIIRHQPPTPVPGTSQAVLGLINLRSMVVPVLSLRTIFDMPPHEPDGRSRIVIVSLEGARLGLLVDEVLEVRTFAATDIQPAPAFVSGDGHHAIGIAQTEAGLVVLIDVEEAVGSVDLGRAG